jgi:hypothetical protein
MFKKKQVEQKRIEDFELKTGIKNCSKLIGQSNFAGFRFMKSILIRTRFPLHEYILELLNGLVGKRKKTPLNSIDMVKL